MPLDAAFIDEFDANVISHQLLPALGENCFKDSTQVCADKQKLN